jgi:hypothetical protein
MADFTGLAEADVRTILIAALRELIRCIERDYGDRDEVYVIDAVSTLAAADAYTPPI